MLTDKPVTSISDQPSPVEDRSISKFGGTVNRLSHHLFRQIMWQASRQADRAARQQVLNLPPAPFLGSYNSPILRQYPTLYGFSSSVIPQPADWHNTQVTGYWFLDEADDWTPPVYVGFGSMGSRNPAETIECLHL